MGFFWKHKLISLLIAALIAYWFMNPSGRFGFTRPGFVVYNRMPIAFMDVYVKPSGEVALLEDLRKPSSITYWVDNHLPYEDRTSKRPVLLFVGTGFSSSGSFVLGPGIVQVLRDRRMAVRQMPSPDAIAAYNAARDSGHVASILMKLD